MKILFGKDSKSYKRKDDRFDGDGVFIDFEDQKLAVIDLSLGGLVLSDVHKTMRVDQKFKAELVLPMAVLQRKVPVSLKVVRIDNGTTACSIDNPSYETMMSIRQYILKMRNMT